MIVYRIQPQDAELHGIETETSNEELAGGVHVFESIPEVYGCREWHNDENVELVEIECERKDLKANGDYEGVTLRKGCGKITKTTKFRDITAIVAWCEERI